MGEKTLVLLQGKRTKLSNRICKGYKSTCLTTKNAFDEATV